LGAAGALNSAGTNSVTVTNNSSGVLQLGGNSATIAGLNTSPTIAATVPVVENASATAATLTVNNAGANTFAGTLRDGTGGGALALTKTGAGSLTLSGSVTYTGATSIAGGSLVLTGNSSLASSPSLSVAAGSTLNVAGTTAASLTMGGAQSLMGSGSVIGNVITSSGSTIHPGSAGIGTLTVGGITLNSGSIFNYEFGAGANNNDFIVVTNPDALVINGGGFNLYQVGTTNRLTTAGTYNLFQFNGGLGGGGVASLTASSILNPQGGLSYSFDTSGNVLRLIVTGAAGVTATWNSSTGGSWNTAGSWTPSIPNGQGATARFAGSIAAPATVTLDGSKTVGGVEFDNGTNSYTIAQGSGGGSLTLNNGAGNATLNVLNGNHAITAPVSLASNVLVTVANAGNRLSLSGAVSGTGSVTKIGAGTLSLTGSNSYTAGTQINAGAVEFAALDNLGAGEVGFGGGLLRWLVGNTADISEKLVTFGSGGATLDTNGNNVTLLNSIGNSGEGGLTKTGAGVLTLGFGNSYSGPNTLVAGTLNISNDSSLGNVPLSAQSNVTFNPGAGNSATLQSSAPLTLTAARGVVLASGTGVIDTLVNDTTIAGVISGTGILRKEGSARLTLSGDNSYSGGTVVTAGTLALGGFNSAGTGSITLSNETALQLSSGGNANPLILSGVGTNVALTATSLSNGYGGVITGSTDQKLTVQGATQVSFGSSNTKQFQSFNGTVSIAQGSFLRFSSTSLNNGGDNTLFEVLGTLNTRNNGAVALGGLSGNGNLTMGTAGGINQNVTYTIGAKGIDTVFSGVISDGDTTNGKRVAIVKTGPGVLALTGANIYTGTTTVNAGTLLVGNQPVDPTVSGSINGTTAVNVAGGVFQLGHSDVVNNLANVTLSGGTFSTQGFDEQVGFLTLAGSAFLDLGATGDSVLRFENSSADVWTGSLSITNWSGSTAGGGVDQLFFGVDNTGLTASQLALVQFLNPAGFDPGTYGAQILPTGELVVVPEPGAITSLLGGLGVLLALRRRRR
jgi:autotransporter-associated beta strand protein